MNRLLLLAWALLCALVPSATALPQPITPEEENNQFAGANRSLLPDHPDSVQGRSDDGKRRGRGERSPGHRQCGAMGEAARLAASGASSSHGRAGRSWPRGQSLLVAARPPRRSRTATDRASPTPLRQSVTGYAEGVGKVAQFNQPSGIRIDSSAARPYVNGVRATGRRIALRPNPGGRLRLEGSRFLGLLDEVAAYDQALSPDNVRGHFAAGAHRDRLTALRSGAGTLVPLWFDGALWDASSVRGPWAAVAGAADPWTVVDSEGRRFFPLKTVTRGSGAATR